MKNLFDLRLENRFILWLDLSDKRKRFDYFGKHSSNVYIQGIFDNNYFLCGDTSCWVSTQAVLRSHCQIFQAEIYFLDSIFQISLVKIPEAS